MSKKYNKTGTQKQSKKKNKKKTLADQTLKELPERMQVWSCYLNHRENVAKINQYKTFLEKKSQEKNQFIKNG